MMVIYPDNDIFAFYFKKRSSLYVTCPVHDEQCALYTCELPTLSFSTLITLITPFSQCELYDALNVPFSISQKEKITDLITDIISFPGLVSKQKS